MTAATPESASNPSATVAALAEELRAALPMRSNDTLSIHDRHGDPVWISSEAVGPSEQILAIEAITVFQVEGHRAFVSEPLTEGQGAAVLPIAALGGELQGVALLVADTGTAGTDSAAKLVTPQVRSILQRLAGVLKPSSNGARRQIAGAPRLIKPRTDPFVAPAADDDKAAEQLLSGKGSTSATGRHLGIAATGRFAALKTEAVRDVSLHVQQLMKLRSGGRTRRYEVLVRGKQAQAGEAMDESLIKALKLSETAGAIDRLVIAQLAKWLKAHPTIWNNDPASFSVNLSVGSLLDPAYARFVAQCLQSSGVAPDTIGFEIPESAILKHRDAVARFILECEKSGCYVVIDDFTLHSDVLPFLSSRAMRVVKIDPNLTTAAMNDRLSQAVVIAISQASKVLGLHCVAKRIDSTAARQWLAAVGIDFAQGYLLEDPRPLDTLASQQSAPARGPARTPNKAG